MKKLMIVLTSALLLSGCAAGLGEDFSCNKVGGVGGCITMDEVRRNPTAYQGHSSKDQTQKAQAPQTVFMALPRRDRNGAPVRTIENVKTVTIFPFKSETGHYIDTTDIHIVIEESRWSGRPAREIWKD